MKGSVRKRYNNAWSYRIDLGFVDGKRKQVEKGGFKTEREATKAMQDVLYHLNNTGDYVENKKVSFHTVYEEFIEREGKATRAYATLKRYDSLYRNHIKAEFGPLYVYQISDTMIIDFLNQKRIKYSEEYVKGMYKFFNVILRYAHDHKYTKKNVMDLVPPPPDPRHVGDIVTYNRKELEQMIERIESTRSKIAFQLGLQAGLRESECFALTWSDIDFEKKKIKVCKQLLYQDTMYFGDYIDNGDPAIQATMMWQAMRQACYDFRDAYNEQGGNCTVVDLPQEGITGNDHFMFQDLNNDVIADHIENWIQENVK